jgi:AcrR family transcriptional regulator
LSPRPRTASNSDILDGAARAVSRVGAARLTLADVADEVGLAPATLIQRFGSKRALLLALAEHGRAVVGDRLELAREANLSPLDALLEAASDVIPDVDTPEALSHQLAFLQFEAGDPDFHQVALEHALRATAGYHALLDDAVATGELTPCDTHRLARAVQALAMGSLINWAVHREGSAREWVVADIALLLDSHRIRGVRSVPDDVSIVSAAERRLNRRSSAAPSAAGPVATAPIVTAPIATTAVATAPRSSGPRARHSGHASTPPISTGSPPGPHRQPVGPPLSTGPVIPSPAPRARGDL